MTETWAYALNASGLWDSYQVESKSVWRDRCRQRRRLAWPSEAEIWSNALASSAFLVPDGVLEPVLPPSPGLVAAYRSYGVEPPTAPLIANLLMADYQVIVPAAVPDYQHQAWVEIKVDDLANPTISIGRNSKVLPSDVIRQAECIIVPALAVDCDGTRLGQGGGWYDRALALAKPSGQRVAMVNPAEFFPAGTLPRLSHDQVMTHALLPDALQGIGLTGPVTRPELRA